MAYNGVLAYLVVTKILIQSVFLKTTVLYSLIQIRPMRMVMVSVIFVITVPRFKTLIKVTVI